MILLGLLRILLDKFTNFYSIGDRLKSCFKSHLKHFKLTQKLVLEFVFN
ncbi:hypothetical protein VSF3289_01145 [Vibrio scophthalmi]|uniref:Uncharacterized protein n=1 Tax=Vibrio scophthalmi TaxID=45658 RepID=A0A1E3WMB9_9VIBR|nr:hypothetical protein VSF3289_01145 [Vibrio scophthalmi]